jgi:hypothetical protein
MLLSNRRNFRTLVIQENRKINIFFSDEETHKILKILKISFFLTQFIYLTVCSLSATRLPAYPARRTNNIVFLSISTAYFRLLLH